MKKFLCVLLAALLTLSFASVVFASDYWDEQHSGTEEDPYVIDSNADLIALRDRVNAGTEAADKYYRLTENRTISSITNWPRIGTDTKPFKGHFDGNNKTIQVNILGADGAQGLFGTIETAEESYAIKSLTVNGTVTGRYVGGIAVRLNSGNIENCSFSGTLETKASAGNGYSGNAGGIACYLAGGSISNSSFNGDIKTNLIFDQKDGGIVAQMTGGSIENCTANGTINIPNSNNRPTYVGGIVGHAQIANFSAVKECTFSGTLTSRYMTGGIAGYISGGNVQNNHVTAVSTSNSSITGTYVAGGIAGRIGDNVTLESCDVASGTTVTATTEAAGGIVGLLNDSSTVQNNISYAQILGDTANKGGVIGKIVASTYTITGNKYSSTEYGIGYNAAGEHSNEGCEKIGESISITTTSLAEANAGEAYSVTLTTTASATTTLAWSMANATTLPDGMNINSSTGVISGTPTKAGTYTFTVQATAGANPATKELTLKVNLVIKTAASLTAGTVDKSYSQTLEATGATSVTWALKTGSTLPSGLALSGSRISGTPKEAVTGKTFTIVATGNGMTAERTFSLTITASTSNNSNNNSTGNNTGNNSNGESQNNNTTDDTPNDESSSSSSGGSSGGGCNAGLGICSLAALTLLKRRGKK